MDFLLAVLAAAAATLALVLAFSRRAPGSESAVLEGVARTLGGLQAELARLARAHEDLRGDVQRGREASLVQLSQATQALRGDIGLAHRALAEVKALEQGRARHQEQAADSLRRLEAVLAGSASRGAAGENILARALAQLPPDLLEVNVPFGGKMVEYALRLPAGRYLPIDSKWTSLSTLEQLEAATTPADRRRLTEQVARELRGKLRDMSKYLDPQRTAGLGLLAVPEAVYLAVPESHGEGWREGVLVAPYGMALPLVLALYRLAVRFGVGVDEESLAASLRDLEDTLERAAGEVEGRLSRGLVQIDNARDALRAHVLEARRVAGRLRRSATEEALGEGGAPGLEAAGAARSASDPV